MSKDSGSGSGGGLFSKVVKFVRSPTTQWSDLDRPDSTADGADSRMALREMIERKRRNDFVRNREFNMLRALRRREGTTGAGMQGTPSFYVSSLPSGLSERQQTLKKIDEIEEQMSESWFRRQDAAGVTVRDGVPGAAPTVIDTTATKPPLPPTARPHGMAQPPNPGVGAASVPARSRAASQAAASQAAAPTVPTALAPTAARGARGGMNLLSDVPSFEVEVMVSDRHDPEIEEVAIRFANGDVAGAEAGLLELLAEGNPRRDDVEAWLTLFDLYRATRQQEKFDNAAVEFAGRFGRSAPQWSLVTEQAAVSAAPAAPTAAALGAGAFHWSCPSKMGVQSLAALNANLDRHAPPWRLDWRHLKEIEEEALPQLIEVMRRLAEAPAELKFCDGERLLDLLAERTPQEDRAVDHAWWLARLAALRAMGRADEFEVTALNYCVTYEVSPPAWEDPRSSFAAISHDGVTIPPEPGFGPDAAPTTMLQDFRLTSTLTSGLSSIQNEAAIKIDLEGEVLGSADAILRSVGVRADDHAAIEFHCRRLLRVDFAAAGDLLNWLTAQQAADRAVSFHQVNRLVAAFLGVIGINEFARVLMRAD